MPHGYKLLCDDGGSISDTHTRVRYPLPRDGAPGGWIDVPGNGAYLADALTEALFATRAPKRGDLIVRLEGAKPTGALAPAGVTCYRRVRVMEVLHDACIKWADGTREWCRDGVRHRDDGPAVEERR